MNTEKEMHLVPYRGEEETLRVLISSLETQNKKEKPRLRARIRLAFCAVACLFFQLTVFLMILSVLEPVRPIPSALRLAERVFFGASVLSVSTDDTLTAPDFPEAEKEETPPPAVPENPPAAENGTQYPIASVSLAQEDLLALSNATDYQPDMQALLASALPFSPPEEGDEDPYVLILHTHATESYTPEGANTYSESDTFRSTDTEKNMVAVGAVLAEELRTAGIPTLHCTELFDAASYSAAYGNAAEAIRAYLAEYPSISVVLDVHRDSVVRADGTRLRPVTEIGGESTAQVMFVVGTDEMGGAHPTWEKNLTFALRLQSDMRETDAELVRPINLRGATFNEQYRSGSLLVEIGSCGNTLSEAKRAARQVAHSLIRVLTGERDV